MTNDLCRGKQNLFFLKLFQMYFQKKEGGMSEENVMTEKVKDFYKIMCRSEWNATVTGVLVAFLSVMIMAWWRPWGAVGAIRNWGDWIMYGITSLTGAESGFFSYYLKEPKSVFQDSGSIIGIGFVTGAFISACLGKDFAFRIPPYREMVKAMIAGVLMGIGATLAGGCNVGGMYNAIGNLAANGFTMWIGLVAGVLLGLKLLYIEMEYITWGDGGSATIELPSLLLYVLGIVAMVGIFWGAYTFAGNTEDEYLATLSGVILIAAALGYVMQRGRWCMVQGFREPHMTGDCTLAKSVALSILIVAVGAAVLKYSVPLRMEGVAVLDPANYVRGTFGWGSIVGGFIFGLGAMLAGGCGSGTLWRVGEGQVKLIMVVPFFAVSNSIMTAWFKANDFEGRGLLGYQVYLPDVMGYGGTLFFIAAIMMVWYLVVTWNEETNKLIVPM